MGGSNVLGSVAGGGYTHYYNGPVNPAPAAGSPPYTPGTPVPPPTPPKVVFPPMTPPTVVTPPTPPTIVTVRAPNRVGACVCLSMCVCARARVCVCVLCIRACVRCSAVCRCRSFHLRC